MHINFEATEEAIYWRGVFVHRYGAIEFALCELLARARLLDEYAELEELPFKWTSKLRVCRELIALDGRIDSYRLPLAELLDGLPPFEVYRHLLVHGLMNARPEASGAVVSFKSYDHVKGKGLGLVTLELPIQQLMELCDDLAPISGGFSGIVAKICREVPLPRLSGDAPVSHR